MSFMPESDQVSRHIITKKGVSTDLDKVRAIKQWPISKNLGLTSYYHQFIKDCGKITAPLKNLLKKDAFK